MTAIRWSAEAAADLEAIYAFISRDSEFYARAVCSALVGTVDQLQAFPQSGRVVPELRRDDYRELLHGNYRIVYRLRDSEAAEIVTIVHGARLLRLEARNR